MKRSVKKKGQAGFATVLALSILALAAIIGGALMLLMPQVEATGERYASTMTAKNAAEAGFRRAVAEMRYAAGKNNMNWENSNWLNGVVAVDGNGSVAGSTENGKAYYTVTVKEVTIKSDGTEHGTEKGTPTEIAVSGTTRILKPYISEIEDKDTTSSYYLVTSKGQFNRAHEINASTEGTEYATVVGFVTLKGDTTSGYEATEYKTDPSPTANLIADNNDKFKETIEKEIEEDPTKVGWYVGTAWNGKYGYVLVESNRLTFSHTKVFEVFMKAFGSIEQKKDRLGRSYYVYKVNGEEVKLKTGHNDYGYTECYIEFSDPSKNPFGQAIDKKPERDWWWNMYQINIYRDKRGNEDPKYENKVVFKYSASWNRYDSDYYSKGRDWGGLKEAPKVQAKNKYGTDCYPFGPLNDKFTNDIKNGEFQVSGTIYSSRDGNDVGRGDSDTKKGRPDFWCGQNPAVLMSEINADFVRYVLEKDVETYTDYNVFIGMAINEKADYGY